MKTKKLHFTGGFSAVLETCYVKNENLWSSTWTLNDVTKKTLTSISICSNSFHAKHFEYFYICKNLNHSPAQELSNKQNPELSASSVGRDSSDSLLSFDTHALYFVRLLHIDDNAFITRGEECVAAPQNFLFIRYFFYKSELLRSSNRVQSSSDRVLPSLVCSALARC